MASSRPTAITLFMILGFYIFVPVSWFSIEYVSLFNKRLNFAALLLCNCYSYDRLLTLWNPATIVLLSVCQPASPRKILQSKLRCQNLLIIHRKLEFDPFSPDWYLLPFVLWHLTDLDNFVEHRKPFCYHAEHRCLWLSIAFTNVWSYTLCQVSSRQVRIIPEPAV